MFVLHLELLDWVIKLHKWNCDWKLALAGEKKKKAVTSRKNGLYLMFSLLDCCRN